jgi:hypothetical protein
VAVLAAPTIAWGAAIEPQAITAPVLAVANGLTFGPTALVLSAPASNQLVPPPPTPEAGLFVWQRHIVDASGNALTGARISVRHAETNAFAEIYADRDALTRRQNPFVVDAGGFARFYALAGLYNITSSYAGLERTYEDVLLGIRLDDIPNLTDLVTPIVADLVEPTLEEIAATLEELPDLVWFTVSGAGVASGPIPDTWSTSRLTTGRYRVTHNLSTMNYTPKLTVWDNFSGRVISAMMLDKQTNFFDYQVRSIFDEADGGIDMPTEIEVTIA